MKYEITTIKNEILNVGRTYRKEFPADRNMHIAYRET
jgi:hypothetical protein